MALPFQFDFKNPDYVEVFEYRLDTLIRLRQNPEEIKKLSIFYKDNLAQFINDWGITFDPRNVERGLPAVIPFILFPRQEEWIDWVLERWKKGEPGLSDKSRDMGVSWLMIAISSAICLFHDGVSIGFGSRKEVYVDKKDDPKSLLQKVRQFVSHIPDEFRKSWDINKHAPYMRVMFPDTNSLISGEAGDGIGRGDRTSIYFIDESAWLLRPDLVESSLSATTNCPIHVSTPHGMNNPFARKRHGGKISVFTLRWQDDPRKNLDWYNKKCFDIDDPVVIAQEIDLDYSASVEGVLIPAIWVAAAVDAHVKLNIESTGCKKMSLDIADEGKDQNSAAGRHGFLLEYLESWSGKGSDIFASINRTFTLCDILGYDEVRFDSDGLGAGARGDARILNEQRSEKGIHEIVFDPFRGSGAVIDPEDDPFRRANQYKENTTGRTNEDFFANAKAQAWWSLRRRFQSTYRAVVEGKSYEQEDIISISSSITEYRELIVELSQPTYSQNKIGKIIVNKAPDGSPSPNKADAVMILFAPIKKLIGGFGSDDYLF